MEYATDAAHRLIEEFTTRDDEREAIKLGLSEWPIGDEYGLLSDYDREVWDRFERFAKERGVTLFKDISSPSNR